jgi:hypothetical protein
MGVFAEWINKLSANDVVHQPDNMFALWSAMASEDKRKVMEALAQKAPSGMVKSTQPFHACLLRCMQKPREVRAAVKKGTLRTHGLEFARSQSQTKKSAALRLRLHL